MSQRSLEDLLRSSGDPVGLLRNSPAGPNVYPGVPAEYIVTAPAPHSSGSDACGKPFGQNCAGA